MRGGQALRMGLGGVLGGHLGLVVRHRGEASTMTFCQGVGALPGPSGEL